MDSLWLWSSGPDTLLRMALQINSGSQQQIHSCVSAQKEGDIAYWF